MSALQSNWGFVDLSCVSALRDMGRKKYRRDTGLYEGVRRGQKESDMPETHFPHYLS